MESGGRSAAHDPRRVAHHHRPGPQDRRRPVKRYSAARETFNRRRGSHFAELDRERAGAKQAKEKLCEQAEELSGSTDWAATAATFRDLLTQWKAAGRAAKDVDDALWHRFKSAQDTFFAARNAISAESDAEFTANATAKEALLAEAEKLDTSNLEAARSALRTLTDKWDAIGKVPGNDRQTWSDGCARWRRRSATPPTRGGPTRRPGARRAVPGPRRAVREAGREGRGGRSHQGGRRGQGQREQWRQWADAAVGALGRSARRTEIDVMARCSRSCAPERRVGRLGRAGFGGRRRWSPRSRRSTSSSSDRDWRSAASRRRSSRRRAGPRCGSRPPGPVEGQQDHGDPPEDQADARAGMTMGGGLARPDRQHPDGAGQTAPDQGEPGQHPPRVSSASMEKPTPKTSASQVNIRDGRAMPTLMAWSLPTRTSSPRAPPVCGRISDTSSTNTRIATTRARAPGWISPATLRSAASISFAVGLEVVHCPHPVGSTGPACPPRAGPIRWCADVGPRRARPRRGCAGS